MYDLTEYWARLNNYTKIRYYHNSKDFYIKQWYKNVAKVYLFEEKSQKVMYVKVN